MFEGGYRIIDGKIQELVEGGTYYDVDLGYISNPDFWINVCDDTPLNREKFGL